MMANGLLGGLDPQAAMLMGLASGLLGPRSREGFGAALGDGMTQGFNAYAGALSAADKRKLDEENLAIRRQEALMREQEAAMRKAQFDAQMADAARKQARDEAMGAAFSSNFDPGARGGEIADYTGEFQTAPRAPSFNAQGFAGKLGGFGGDASMKALELLQSLQPKPLDNPLGKLEAKDYTPESIRAYMASRTPGNPTGDPSLLAPVRSVSVHDGVAYDPRGMAPGTRLDSVKPNQPFNMVNGQIVPNPDYQQFAKDAARAGASSQTVNMGQQGFRNTRDLRNDYNSLPETKAYKELQTTADIIRTALATPSPANDLAAATKFMKLLDPGSVVRESELAMAMSATGLLDRIGNYHNMLLKGEKLTPAQRKDFAESTTRIFAAAERQQQKVAQRARDEAVRWELDPNAVAPELLPGSAPKRLRFNPTTGQLE